MTDSSLCIQLASPASKDDLALIVRSYTKLTTYTADHPDVHVIAPLEGKMSISIDQVHEIQRDVLLSPVFGMQKVYLFYPADALTLPAQQALLKLLEEPPSHSVLMLVATAPNLLLPTVLSRCVRINHTVRQTEEEQSRIAKDFSWPTTHAQAIKFADEYGSKKETSIAFVREVIANEKDSHKKKAAINALGLLTKNISTKLVLDELFFPGSN